jgi:hypothetical protein
MLARFLSLLLWLATLALLPCCSPPPDIEGKYSAQGQDGKVVTLTLKSGYAGEWTTATDATPVRWEIRDGKLLLHGKGGGVLLGVLEDNALRVALPGEGELRFHRAKTP